MHSIAIELEFVKRVWAVWCLLNELGQLRPDPVWWRGEFSPSAGRDRARRGSATGFGSEYPAVVIPLTIQHYTMLQRNLVYTGVTRGKRLVVLVGQRKALAIAVKGARGRRRWSKLREWLLECDGP